MNCVVLQAFTFPVDDDLHRQHAFCIQVESRQCSEGNHDG